MAEFEENGRVQEPDAVQETKDMDFYSDPWAEEPLPKKEAQPEHIGASAVHTETILEKRAKTAKKKSSFFEKAFVLVVSAILFGAIAGGAFLGVKALSELFGEKKNGQELDAKNETDDTIPNEGRNDVILNHVGLPSQTGTEGETEGVPISAQVSAADVSPVVESVMPAIVAINCYRTYTYGTWSGGQGENILSGSGSGIIVGQNDTEVLVVTNNHVIEDADYVELVFDDGAAVIATVKGTAPSSDLAVVAVKFSNLSDETLASIRIARLGNSDEVKIGEMAIAIGNALGYGQSVTVGYISALDREITVDGVDYKLIQTDAAINPGNSGGALLNAKGEVIGINSVKYSNYAVEGMGFAIPISSITDIIEELSNYEEIEEDEAGYAGISGRDITEAYSNLLGIPVGVYVSEIERNSPADQGGVWIGDIIVGVDNTEITSMSDWQRYLERTKAGTEVTLNVMRNIAGEYRRVELTIVLSTKPEK